MVGRRRVGKSTLLKQAFEGKNVVYLFVSRKAEPLLAEEFTEQIKAQLDLPIYGQPDSLKAILEILLTYAKSNPITVIMDEFQDIQKVNASFFSDMQNLWDSHRLDARMHLICCGSLYSMMTHLFQNSKQPLFGRADHRINLQPLQVELLAQPVLRFTNTGGFWNKSGKVQGKRHVSLFQKIWFWI